MTADDTVQGYTNYHQTPENADPSFNVATLRINIPEMTMCEAMTFHVS